MEVLRQVDHSVGALNRAVPASARELDAYEALLEGLEAAGKIHRDVEALPSVEEWQTAPGRRGRPDPPRAGRAPRCGQIRPPRRPSPPPTSSPMSHYAPPSSRTSHR